MAEAGEKRKDNRWVIVIVVLIVLAILLCGCLAIVAVGWLTLAREPLRVDATGIGGQVEATREIERVFSVDTPVSVEINADVGPIRVTGTDAERVSVHALVRAWGSSSRTAQEVADVVIVEIAQRDADHVRVTGRNPTTFMSRSPSVTFELRVPHQCRVEIASDVGNLTLEEIEGSADVRTNVGSIKARNLVLIEDSHLSTNVGEIEISLPETSQFRLDAEANVGRINSDFEVEGPRERRMGPADRLRGVVGRGPSVRLTLRTDTGTISIRATRCNREESAVIVVKTGSLRDLYECRLQEQNNMV